MKKSIISLAVLAAASNVAMAQSSVTIYGQIDAGFVSEHGGKNGAVNKVSSGVGGNSRIGFKGVEDLGNGLQTVFVLESGFNEDTGTQDTSGSLFNRQAYVGLASATAGTVTLGRQYTPLYTTIVNVADPFGGNYAGTAKNLLPTAGSNTRTSNTLMYTSPTAYGFSGEAAYAAGEQAGDNTAGRQWGAAATYKNGPLVAKLAYNSRNNDVQPGQIDPVTGLTSTTGQARGNSKNTILAVNYDFQIVKAYASYGVNKGFNSSAYNGSAAVAGTAYGPQQVASTDTRDELLGLSAPVGLNGTVMASVIHKEDRIGGNDANQYGVGYSYALSKRTSAYIAYAHINNHGTAAYTVGNNNEVGTGDSAYNIGLHHAF